MNKAIITTINNILFLFIYEGERLVECHPFVKNNTLKIGNIYIGRVEKVVKNIQGAFIRLDSENVGYLPLDNKPYRVLNRVLPKGLPSIAENDTILVQVEQEPLKLKQAKVTGNISLHGNLIALDLEKSRCGISKKIKSHDWLSELRKRKFADSPYGYILRTACQNATEEEICKEYHQLTKKMDELLTMAQYEKKTGCIYEGKPDYVEILNMYGFHRLDVVKTDSLEVYDVLKKENIASLQLYEEEYPLSKLLGLETELSHILSKKVWLKSGGFLIIEPTEAMVVVDVNTGKSIGKKNRDTHILNINLEAAREIARQIRLRNLSGIIMIDFINMETEQSKQILSGTLAKELGMDKVSSRLIDITKLDLYEVTRKKIRKPIYEMVEENFLKRKD